MIAKIFSYTAPTTTKEREQYKKEQTENKKELMENKTTVCN